ncbi:hypothetical protein LTR85_008927 [Meristemomyces frigidus]|nr:hypothetical protein LTR85_008927 [Meristemomyces frigidus]
MAKRKATRTANAQKGRSAPSCDERQEHMQTPRKRQKVRDRVCTGPGAVTDISQPANSKSSSPKATSMTPSDANTTPSNASRTQSDATTQSTSRLLALPPELRDEIYRFALVEEKIVVDATRHTTPGVLRTCRQIRKEASPIFYRENAFVVVAMDLRAPVPVQHWFNHRVPDKRRTIKDRGDMNWVNLKAWLQIYHEQPYFGFGGKAARDDGDLILYAFNVVDKMRSAPWDMIEGVLEDFRNAAGSSAVVRV